jgi:hypothetical protein
MQQEGVAGPAEALAESLCFQLSDMSGGYSTRSAQTSRVSLIPEMEPAHPLRLTAHKSFEMPKPVEDKRTTEDRFADHRAEPRGTPFAAAATQAIATCFLAARAVELAILPLGL